MTPAQLIDACRIVAKTTNVRRRGPWTVEHFTPATVSPRTMAFYEHHNGRLAPYKSWTCLFRDTETTMHLERGECVMDDSPKELRRHLPILLAARGRVLVTGLGLGCVARGLLAKPDVQHVTIVEIDRNIINLMGSEFRYSRRCTLVHADADADGDWSHGMRWDFAWHDVWSATESLALVHARLLARYAPQVMVAQGAWQFPREMKRIWLHHLLGAGSRHQPMSANRSCIRDSAPIV